METQDVELLPVEEPEERPEDELVEELLPELSEEEQGEIWREIDSDYRAAIEDRLDWERS